MTQKQYDWYPGHMTKARRMMEENLKLVDLILELVDARIPVSSRNPDIDTLANGKARILLLNKSDLADEKATKQFLTHYEALGFGTLDLDARSRQKNKTILTLVQEACRERIERNKKRGIIGRPMRAMVVGVPNVGKSTFINSVCGKAVAKTGNKPGVTKGKQWLRLNKDLELLDTPGITWPKFEDPSIALKLALVGSMKDDMIDRQTRFDFLNDYLAEHYPDALREKYGAGTAEEIAMIKHLLLPGAEPDTERAKALVLDDFKNGRLGRITLDPPSVI
ncbi:MAG: ribosome biogenesis GTPase YlqF [Lachnospiraceae bacterium]|nr:ribosome biogenesis GTPase YlqF [Lachnospiraceae bacterium]